MSRATAGARRCRTRGSLYQLLLAGSLVAGLAIGCKGSDNLSAHQATPPSDTARGAEVFQEQSRARCHGEMGQGGRAVSLVPLSDTSEAWLAQFRAAHTGDYASSKLPDSDLRAIYSWLESHRSH